MDFIVEAPKRNNLTYLPILQILASPVSELTIENPLLPRPALN
jgi:hypothetical protein